MPPPPWNPGAIAESCDFPLSVSGRLLVDASRSPFYWASDTHWPLFWHYSPDELSELLDDRVALGFTAIAMSLVAFSDAPNANGDHTFADSAALEPNEAYFQHVDTVLDELERRNLAVYLVVLWWNQIKGTSSPYAVDPSLDTCYTYGRTLGQRWRERRNLVWVWAPSPDRRASSSSSSSASASHWPHTP